jgi:RNA polymerase sigma-70 factor (ECF subfamily)
MENFEEVYAKYHRLVFKACRDAAPSYPVCIAEEWAQEAWIHLLNQWDRFIVPTDLPEKKQEQVRVGWIYTIAHRKAIDCYRKESKHDVRSSPQQDEGVDCLDVVESEIDTRLALDSLSQNLREAIELMYGLGMTQKEAANCLNVSEEAIKKRVQRAKKQLKQIGEQDD